MSRGKAGIIPAVRFKIGIDNETRQGSVKGRERKGVETLHHHHQPQPLAHAPPVSPTRPHKTYLDGQISHAKQLEEALELAGAVQRHGWTADGRDLLGWWGRRT